MLSKIINMLKKQFRIDMNNIYNTLQNFGHKLVNHNLNELDKLMIDYLTTHQKLKYFIKPWHVSINTNDDNETNNIDLLKVLPQVIIPNDYLTNVILPEQSKNYNNYDFNNIIFEPNSTDDFNRYNEYLIINKVQNNIEYNLNIMCDDILLIEYYQVNSMKNLQMEPTYQKLSTQLNQEALCKQLTDQQFENTFDKNSITICLPF